MNLTSCDQCGVVLDRNKIIFPEPWNDETQSYDPQCSEWREGDFVAYVSCPVCGGKIFDQEV